MTTDPARTRDGAVDALRGLAIGAMVWGHLGVAIYHPDGRGEPSTTLDALPPLWTEVVGGFAPALFLFVCGMMVHHGQAERGGALRHQLLRMVALLGIGATIDVAFWRIRPFTTVDVLYCIALTLPVTHLFSTHVPRSVKPAVATLGLALGPLLQRLLGYSDYPTEMSLGGKVFQEIPNQTSILQHWLVDGWFPLFPWLGFALLGAAIHERRLTRADEAGSTPVDPWVLGAGAATFATSFALGWPDASARVEARLRAGGAFMPPDISYLLASVGVVFLVISLVDRLEPLAALGPLRGLGRHPLFVYVTHFPLVKIISKVLPVRVNLVLTTLITFLALAVLGGGGALFSAIVKRLRRRLQSSSPRTSGVEGSRK